MTAAARWRGGSHNSHERNATQVWVHRALLADKRRTTNPAEATLFFVPAYLTASKKQAGHDERLDGLIQALERDPYFQKNGGRDHVFGYSSWNPSIAKGIGLHRVSKLLKQGHFGVFEVNNAWIGANSQEAGRLDLRDRMIPMPYVVNAATFRGDHREVHTHKISVFFAAKARGNAVGWAGCDRRKGLGLQSVPRASIHVHRRLEGRRLLDQATFAHHMRVADFCLVMCGDTPTSRRIFDAIIADCIPLIVGTRLWGRCDPPCHKGWGWSISGPDHPHLPFHDTFIDYTRFPRVDEAHFYVFDACVESTSALGSNLNFYTGRCSGRVPGRRGERHRGLRARRLALPARGPRRRRLRLRFSLHINAFRSCRVEPDAHRRPQAQERRPHPGRTPPGEPLAARRHPI